MTTRDVIDLKDADEATRKVVEDDILYRWVLLQAKHPDNGKARVALLAAGAKL